MRAELIKINGMYRMKDEVFTYSVQASGEPFPSRDVTIVRVKYPAGRQRAWYYDAAGNAFRASDLQEPTPVIAVEL